MHLSPSQPAHRRSAFSLLEVLVTTVIIGVIAVIVTQASGRIRQGVEAARCLSNLRQIGLALNAYANDNQQFYPPTYSSVRKPKNLKTWMTLAGQYAGYSSDAMGSAPYPRATGIFYCPEMTEEHKAARGVGYFYNGNIVQVEIRRQALSPRTFLVVEGPPANSEAISFAAFSAASHQRHPRAGSNFLSVDGSVELCYPPFTDARWSATPEP